MPIEGGQVQSISLDDLMDYNVIGADGKNLGDVEDIILSNNELYTVIGAGGFLGLGEKQVALPLSDMVLRGNQLVMPTLTEEQVKNMREVDADQYERLQPNAATGSATGGAAGTTGTGTTQ